MWKAMQMCLEFKKLLNEYRKSVAHLNMRPEAMNELPAHYLTRLDDLSDIEAADKFNFIKLTNLNTLHPFSFASNNSETNLENITVKLTFEGRNISHRNPVIRYFYFLEYSVREFKLIPLIFGSAVFLAFLLFILNLLRSIIFPES